MTHSPLAGLVRLVSFAALLAAPASADDTLIAKGVYWRYLDDGSDLGTAWQAPAYDDSTWGPSGQAQLGYGDSDEQTVVSFGPNANTKYTTTYFRRQFTVANPLLYVNLALNLLRDDGAVIYLNGTEVVRANMPTGSITYTTFAASTISGAEEDTFYSFSVDENLLVPGVNVLAVELHQRTLTSSDISFDMELIGETGVKLYRGPYLQSGTATDVTIQWRTNTASTGRVRYGSAPGALNQVIDDPVAKENHSIQITGLSPLSTIYYSVGTTGGTQWAGDDVNHFVKTPPPAGVSRPFRAWLLGDSGTADANAIAVRNAYYNFTGPKHTDLWLMLGDNAYDAGADEEYQAAVFDMYPAMLRKSVLWPTRGNHDSFSSVYFDAFTMPTAGEAGGLASGTEAYYSFDWSNVHFICLDSEGSNLSLGGPMHTWLQADLAATDQPWIIAFWHHPPYTKGSHDSDAEGTLISMRQNFLPVLEGAGVDLVFCGHSHSYERSYLIDGHYGLSTSFTTSHLIDGGDGKDGSDGVYVKSTIPHAGTVYTVNGSSGKITGDGLLDHPAMFYSIKALGSVVLDVDADELNVKFLRSTGAVTDEFTIRSYEADSLVGDTATIPLVAGGTQNLTLDAGPAEANRTYWLLGSITGTAPGLPTPQGPLPLNYDAWMAFSIAAPNSSIFGNSLAALDASGQASASVSLRGGHSPASAGLKLYHAYAVFDTSNNVTFVSNAFPVTLVP